MLINPVEIIHNKWITHPDCPTLQHWQDRSYVSPNAIDFTLDELLLINSNDRAFISNNKKLNKMKQLLPMAVYGDVNPRWELEGMKAYDGTSKMYVKVPAGYACVPMFTRSTLNRNGIFIVSGLYDSGYEGHIGFTIYTNGGPIDIEVGTRVGQIGFVKSENAHMYAGGYNHEQGQHYTQAPINVPLGERQIPSNPLRTETGMGPILNTNSDFV